jgi:hypothetical protein
MLPADQRLGGRHAAGGEVDLGLKDEPELVLCEGAINIVLIKAKQCVGHGLSIPCLPAAWVFRQLQYRFDPLRERRKLAANLSI